jgi:hypothetical protein
MGGAIGDAAVNFMPLHSWVEFAFSSSIQGLSYVEITRCILQRESPEIIRHIICGVDCGASVCWLRFDLLSSRI